VTIEGVLPRDDGRRLLRQVQAAHGALAFMRRAKLVESAYQELLGRCRAWRGQELAPVRRLLGWLLGECGTWQAARPWLTDDEPVRTLTELTAAVGLPERAPAAPTSARKIRRALRDLREGVERFNGRWSEFLRRLDLSAVNKLRDGYNRYYLLEKECALGPEAVARDGFRPLPPLTGEALVELLPPLPVPR
jgi:hypothetical protein